jgi:hypothetical protein
MEGYTFIGSTPRVVTASQGNTPVDVYHPGGCECYVCEHRRNNLPVLQGIFKEEIAALKKENADLRYQLQVHRDVAEMQYNYIIKALHALEKQNKE